jgi:hypothetical protein
VPEIHRRRSQWCADRRFAVTRTTIEPIANPQKLTARSLPEFLYPVLGEPAGSASVLNDERHPGEAPRRTSRTHRLGGDAPSRPRCTPLVVQADTSRRVPLPSWRVGQDRELVTSNQRDRYRHLTLADLQLIVRSRRLDLPPELDRDELIIMLRDHDEHPPHPPAEPATTSTRERSSTWTAMSVADLRSLARRHNINVAAGMRRRELIDLLTEHDIPRPARNTSARRRPSA